MARFFFFQFLTVFLSAVLIACQAVPLVPPFTDENGEKESRDFNEVGPDENWQVYGRLMKTKAFDPNGSEKTRVLLKEIEQFSRLAANATADDASSTTTVSTTTEDTDDNATTGRPDGDVVTTEDGQSASDWFGSTWRTLSRDGDDADGRPKSERQDDGNVEDIIRKISNDLKKLYIKIKQVVTVVKNWYGIYSVANTIFAAAG